jgi:hypothetical protein
MFFTNLTRFVCRFINLNDTSSDIAVPPSAQNSRQIFTFLALISCFLSKRESSAAQNCRLRLRKFIPFSYTFLLFIFRHKMVAWRLVLGWSPGVSTCHLYSSSLMFIRTGTVLFLSNSDLPFSSPDLS